MTDIEISCHFSRNKVNISFKILYVPISPEIQKRDLGDNKRVRITATRCKGDSPVKTGDICGDLVSTLGDNQVSLWDTAGDRPGSCLWPSLCMEVSPRSVLGSQSMRAAGFLDRVGPCSVRRSYRGR